MRRALLHAARPAVCLAVQLWPVGGGNAAAMAVSADGLLFVALSADGHCGPAQRGQVYPVQHPDQAVHPRGEVRGGAGPPLLSLPCRCITVRCC